MSANPQLKDMGDGKPMALKTGEHFDGCGRGCPDLSKVETLTAADQFIPAMDKNVLISMLAA